MTNSLPVGASRTGSLIDFNPETPKVTASLRRTKRGIELRIPWPDYSTYYASWFVDTDNPFSGESASASMPTRLLFEDRDGAVLLVGCWTTGYSTTVDGPGVGNVRCRYAVLGAKANLDFELISGLRFEISGLTAWLGYRVVKEEITSRPGLGGLRLAISAEPLDPLVVPGRRGVRLIPTWTSDRGDDSITVRNLVLVERLSSSPVEWRELETEARAIRDLLVLSLWQQEACVITEARREDDRVITFDGEDHGAQWRQAIPARHEKPPKPPRYRSDLILYSEIGLEGIGKWLSLREQYSRALDPIISTRALDAVSPVTLLAQAGPGLEALGYQLLLRDGLGQKRATDASFAARLRRIAADVKDVLPFDSDAWVKATTKTYNGLKHANRKAPRDIDVLNAWRESVLAVRAWVALELGTPTGELAARLANDGQASPWVERR